jgi:pimeloyl-ACP methyl ester carboxylesterase
MKSLFLIGGWMSGLFFAILSGLSFFSGHYLSSLLILVVTALLIPPMRTWLGKRLSRPIPLWLRSILIPSLFFLSIFLIFNDMGNPSSIYKNPETEDKLMRIYSDRMEQWPVPYEERIIDTEYGKVYLIISGPADGPPLILLHASAMSSWSWLYNIEGLNRIYRTYAIDTIGDAGRSQLTNIVKFPADGESLALFYSDLMDSLAIQKASLIGASQGGFIATNIALYAPERVEKLILCGPMGYSGTTLSVLRILFTTMFPVKPVRQNASTWAFGEDPGIQTAVGEWFETILTGVISRQARPQPFSKDQLRKIRQPVLLIVGSRDGLVGDPREAEMSVQSISNVRVKELDTGHLISAEKPQAFNRIVLDFLRS